MRPVKTQPRFKCDFCSKVATAPTIERHEPLCYYNPDRYCHLCDNTGVTSEYFEGYGSVDDPCYWCSEYNDIAAPPIHESIIIALELKKKKYASTNY